MKAISNQSTNEINTPFRFIRCLNKNIYENV